MGDSASTLNVGVSGRYLSVIERNPDDTLLSGAAASRRSLLAEACQ